jgi:hypothetical protein
VKAPIFFIRLSRTRLFTGRMAGKSLSQQKMKTDTIIYWTTTGVICAIMTFSAINFTLSHPLAPGGESSDHLGYPHYFIVELAIAKILAVLALLLPSVPDKIKEFAYFGFGITLLSASIAHFSIGDGIMFVVDPLIFFFVLIISYIYFQKAHRRRT